MKKTLLLILIISFAFSTKSYALDPKAKAFAVVCTYGTVGGALLGFASMAFGTSSRAIAQGASLGLYTGIIFGTYVLTSYQDPSQIYEDPYAPPPGVDPYAPPSPRGGAFGSPGGFGGSDFPREESNEGGFFGPPNRALEINQDYMNSYKIKKGGNTPPIYLNLLNIIF